MAYIITSKTRAKARRGMRKTVSIPSQIDNVRKYGNTTYSPEVRDQYGKVSRANRQEFRNEKRMLELHKKGFNEAAIAGMMFGDKNTTSNERKVKDVVSKYKNKPNVIKTDGNI